MKFRVYVHSKQLRLQLATALSLPSSVLNLPAEELKGILVEHLAPITTHSIFDGYRIDGIREHETLPALPSPAWLSHDETKNVFPGHASMFGDSIAFQWQEFFASVLSHNWMKINDWTTNAKHLGYPKVALSMEALFSEDSPGSDWLRNNLRAEWTILNSHSHAHLCFVHPGPIDKDMHDFIETLPKEGMVFPARTHPMFYVALYEFWLHLDSLPVWAYLPSSFLAGNHRDSAEFTAQEALQIGITASTSRWGWWSLLSNVFAPRSRALDVLEKYYPECYQDGQLFPRPSHMEMNPDLSKLPPRIRVLRDPYK